MKKNHFRVCSRNLEMLLNVAILKLIFSYVLQIFSSSEYLEEADQCQVCGSTNWQFSDSLGIEPHLIYLFLKMNKSLFSGFLTRFGAYSRIQSISVPTNLGLRIRIPKWKSWIRIRELSFSYIPYCKRINFRNIWILDSGYRSGQRLQIRIRFSNFDGSSSGLNNKV